MATPDIFKPSNVSKSLEICRKDTPFRVASSIAGHKLSIMPFGILTTFCFFERLSMPSAMLFGSTFRT